MAKNQSALVVAVPANMQNPSGLIELNPKDVSKMPLAQYFQMQGNFVNTQAAVYYDTAVYAAAAAITPAKIAKLFTKGKAQDSSVVNTGTVIAEKGEYMTNMISDGEFEGGTTFLLEQIAVDIFLTGEPATYGTRGDISNPAHVAQATYSAPNHYQAIARQMELVYMRNEEVKLRGLLREFPSPFIATGAFGSSLGGFIQNGYMRTWNKLSRVPVLQSEDKFSIEIRPITDSWTPTVPFNLTVNLIGQTIKTFIP